MPADDDSTPIRDDDRLKRRLRAFPLFDAAYYRDANPDTRDWDSIEHLIAHGLNEGRRLLRPERLAARLAEIAGEPTQTLQKAYQGEQIKDLQIGITIVLPKAPSDKDRVAAQRLADELRQEGVEIRLPGSEASPIPGIIRITVSRQGIPRDSGWIVLLTAPISEMVETDVFAAALCTNGVIALEPLTATLFHRAGVPAFLWTPSPEMNPVAATFDPLYAGLPRNARNAPAGLAPWGERPIDVAFFGEESHRRDEILGRSADVWAELACVFDIRRAGWRNPPPGPERAALKAFVGSRAKIVLNLAADELATLDWENAVMNGAGMGALVVSTFCLADPEFRAGVHYLEDSGDRLGKLVRHLLGDQGRETAERIAEAGNAVAQASRRRGATAALLNFLLTDEGPTCFP